MAENERRLCIGRWKAGAAATGRAGEAGLEGELMFVATGVRGFIAENTGDPSWEGLKREPVRQTTRPNGSLIRSPPPAVPERFPTGRVHRVTVVTIVLISGRSRPQTTEAA